MADNVALPAVSGSVAADDIGGIKHQRVKVEFGADGTASDVSNANGLPVALQGRNYEAVAASSSAQVLGATGAAGDDIDAVLVIPTTLSPGAVALLDNATSMTIFAGGANSLSNLAPFYIALGMKSVSGPWKLTTGAGLSAIATGRFT